MYIKGCLPKSRALVEHAMKVILCGCSVTVGEEMAIWAIHPPGAWDGYCSETWLLPKGGHRGGEGDRMDEYLCMVPRPKVWHQKMAPKQFR
jgi:hypothetical protein